MMTTVTKYYNILFSKILSQKYFFGGKLVPKLESALFKIKIGTTGYSKLLIPNSTIVFLGSVPEKPFLEKFGRQTSKALFNSVQRGIQGWQF